MVLFGIDQPTAGTVTIDGKSVSLASPGVAMEQGIAYVSEDRIGQSLVMDFSIRNNASLTVLDEATSVGLMSRSKEIKITEP